MQNYDIIESLNQDIQILEEKIKKLKTQNIKLMLEITKKKMELDLMN